MINELTDIEREILKRGFQGPRPGSNSFPLLSLKVDGLEIDGERIDALVRSGVLVPELRSTPTNHEIKGGNAGPYGEVPDIELTHNYRLSRL